MAALLDDREPRAREWVYTLQYDITLHFRNVSQPLQHTPSMQRCPSQVYDGAVGLLGLLPREQQALHADALLGLLQRILVPPIHHQHEPQPRNANAFEGACQILRQMPEWHPALFDWAVQGLRRRAGSHGSSFHI